MARVLSELLDEPVTVVSPELPTITRTLDGERYVLGIKSEGVELSSEEMLRAVERLAEALGYRIVEGPKVEA